VAGGWREIDGSNREGWWKMLFSYSFWLGYDVVSAGLCCNVLFWYVQILNVNSIVWNWHLMASVKSTEMWRLSEASIQKYIRRKWYENDDAKYLAANSTCVTIFQLTIEEDVWYRQHAQSKYSAGKSKTFGNRCIKQKLAKNRAAVKWREGRHCKTCWQCCACVSTKSVL